jgi:hypothetical protein
MNPTLNRFTPSFVSSSTFNQPAKSLTQPMGPMTKAQSDEARIREISRQKGKAAGQSLTRALEQRAQTRQINQTQGQAQAQAPKTRSVLSDAENEYQKRLQKELDRAYKSGLENIQSQVTTLEQRQPELERQVTTQFESMVPGIERQRETALAEARRQYETGLQRGQQVFGGVGASSAAQAVQDVASQELLRQQGQVQTQTSEALNRVNLEKQNTLTKLRDDFRRELQAINAQKFDLASQKSNAQLQALQDFATRRRQLEDFFTERQANIEDQARAIALQATVATPRKASYLTSLGFDDAARKQAIESFIALGDAYLSRNNLKRAKYNGREVLQDTTTNEIFDVDTGANLTIY